MPVRDLLDTRLEQHRPVSSLQRIGIQDRRFINTRPRLRMKSFEGNTKFPQAIKKIVKIIAALRCTKDGIAKHPLRQRLQVAKAPGLRSGYKVKPFEFL